MSPFSSEMSATTSIARVVSVCGGAWTAATTRSGRSRAIARRADRWMRARRSARGRAPCADRRSAGDLPEVDPGDAVGRGDVLQLEPDRLSRSPDVDLACTVDRDLAGLRTSLDPEIAPLRAGEHARARASTGRVGGARRAGGAADRAAHHDCDHEPGHASPLVPTCLRSHLLRVERRQTMRGPLTRRSRARANAPRRAHDRN